MWPWQVRSILGILRFAESRTVVFWSEDDDVFLVYSPYYFGSDIEDGDVDVYNFNVMKTLRKYVKLDLAGRLCRVEDESTKPSTTTYQLLSLQELCCRVIALRFPFAYVEHRSPPIPDELQLKIIGFSFPEDEQMIMKYAQFSSRSVDINSAKSVLGDVKNLNQIGRCDLAMMLLSQK